MTKKKLTKRQQKAREINYIIFSLKGMSKRLEQINSTFIKYNSDNFFTHETGDLRRHLDYLILEIKGGIE